MESQGQEKLRLDGWWRREGSQGDDCHAMPYHIMPSLTRPPAYLPAGFQAVFLLYLIVNRYP